MLVVFTTSRHITLYIMSCLDFETWTIEMLNTNTIEQREGVLATNKLTKMQFGKNYDCNINLIRVLSNFNYVELLWEMIQNYCPPRGCVERCLKFLECGNFLEREYVFLIIQNFKLFKKLISLMTVMKYKYLIQWF